ncbi:MAG: PfkB family carbohydrate kinase [Comamonadaceae bacterium]|nr:PfkB family carbohydrate kinase [Comamonadaceae bacterium]
MLRLSPPDRELLFQSPLLRAGFGGGEANVAVSLALLGHRSRWISVVPSTPAGRRPCGSCRRYGVETGAVVRGGRRLGIYLRRDRLERPAVPGLLRPRRIGRSPKPGRGRSIGRRPWPAWTGST